MDKLWYHHNEKADTTATTREGNGEAVSEKTPEKQQPGNFKDLWAQLRQLPEWKELAVNAKLQKKTASTKELSSAG